MPRTMKKTRKSAPTATKERAALRTITREVDEQADAVLAQADTAAPPLASVERELLPATPADDFAGLDDEPVDEVLEVGMTKGTELKSIMRSDLHGVYVMNRPEVRDDYEAAGYKVAKTTSGGDRPWVVRASAFQTNDKGEYTYGDCVIMVITQNAFLKLMARQKARRHADIAGRGGTLKTTKGAPPPPEPDDEE